MQLLEQSEGLVHKFLGLAFRDAGSSALAERGAGPQHCAQAENQFKAENQFNSIFKIVFGVNFVQQFTKNSRDVIA